MMAARRMKPRSDSPFDLRCDAERLGALLIVLEQATDPNRELHDALNTELRLGLIYELVPRTIEMSRQLAADLGRLDETYIPRSEAAQLEGLDGGGHDR